MKFTNRHCCCVTLKRLELFHLFQTKKSFHLLITEYLLCWHSFKLQVFLISIIICTFITFLFRLFQQLLSFLPLCVKKFPYSSYFFFVYIFVSSCIAIMFEYMINIAISVKLATSLIFDNTK